MQYPKINSLYKRQGCGEFDATQQRYQCDLEKKPRKSLLIVGQYACPEFESITRWLIDEKIDGTNVRIFWDPSDPFSPSFGGRTDNAQMPMPLLEHLQRTFTREKMMAQFPEVRKVILFGEGYGPKIQACGSRYRKDVSFTLFDVWIDGWWLRKEDVLNVAYEMNVEHTIGQQQPVSTSEVVDYVKSRPISYVSEDRTLVMEGIIARAYPLMLFRQHQSPIMFKLKVKDFEDLGILND